MHNISNEIICDIIDHAREIGMESDLNPEEEVGETEADDSKSILAEDKQDLTYDELKKTISELEPDQQQELVALLFVGRGDFDKEQWIEAFSEAANIPTHKRAEYLISHPMLADLLEEGMAKFGFTCGE